MAEHDAHKRMPGRDSELSPNRDVDRGSTTKARRSV